MFQLQSSAVMLPAAVAFGAGAALVAATKIVFLGWGVGNARLDFTGISGHTTLATAVTLTAIHLLSRGLPRPYRLALLAVGLAGAFAVGLSRLASRPIPFPKSAPAW